MLYYFPLSLFFKPIEKCYRALHHCFQWESILCEKNPKMDEIKQKENRICSIFVNSKLSQCDSLIRNTSAYRHSLGGQFSYCFNESRDRTLFFIKLVVISIIHCFLLKRISIITSLLTLSVAFISHQLSVFSISKDFLNYHSVVL